MNKKLLLVVLLGLLAVALGVENQPTELNSGSDRDPLTRMTRCHKSCNCDVPSLTNELDNINCATCNQCRTCKDANASLAGELKSQGIFDFCQCNNGYKEDKNFNCIKVDQYGVPDKTEELQCEWLVFNQIYKMVVHSNCYFDERPVQGSTSGEYRSWVVDKLSFDFRRINAELDITLQCAQILTYKIQWAKDCTNYVDLNTVASVLITKEQDVEQSVLSQLNSLRIEIPLITVYDLADNTVLSQDNRTIYQRICLAIVLGNGRKTIRFHQFQIRVYTLRDQVHVFHLNVGILETKGCDEGQECIVVANLDTRADICPESSCDSTITGGKSPSDRVKYTIGQHLYVRIQFLDSSYTKFLQVVTVKFIDNYGIFQYTRRTQWGVLRSTTISTDVDILLWQPHEEAQVEIALLVSTEPDVVDPEVAPHLKNGLRSLSAKDTTGELVKQNLYAVSVEGQQQSKNASTESNFSGKLFAGFALAALALLF